MDTLFKATPGVRGTTQNIEVAARNLRANMTDAETMLWNALRGRQLDGLKFRRQHPVGPYVLDFFCPSAKLVVEVDGDIHDDDEHAAHDAMRTQRLTAFGYHVMRIRNDDIRTNLPSVLDRIQRAAASPPLPALGEGAGG